jgi:hypothetical protein
VKEGAGGLQTDYFEAYFQQTVSCSPLRSKYIILSGFSTCPRFADKKRIMYDTTSFSIYKRPWKIFRENHKDLKVYLKKERAMVVFFCTE